MKDKLEVGMYVRNKDGTIGKIIAIDLAKPRQEKYPNHPSKRWWRNKILISCYKGWRTTQNIIKASYNIIDILECGDYVNGCYVSNKRASVNEHLGGHPKEIGIIKCNAYFNQGNYNDCKFEWIEEQDIKSIVTHEQMEQMAYKVEE